MMNSVRKLKWLVAVAVVVAMGAFAPIVYGGLKWSGIDPEVDVDGHQVNVTVAVPPGQWCNIDGAIKVEFLVHKKASATLVAESVDTDGSKCGAHTSSSIKHKKGSKLEGKVYVTVVVEAEDGKFPVEVLVVANGEGGDAISCAGQTDKKIKCGPLELGTHHSAEGDEPEDDEDDELEDD